MALLVEATLLVECMESMDLKQIQSFEQSLIPDALVTVNFRVFFLFFFLQRLTHSSLHPPLECHQARPQECHPPPCLVQLFSPVCVPPLTSLNSPPCV